LTIYRDKKAALRFFKKAIRQHGLPDKMTIDKSGANTADLDALNDEPNVNPGGKTAALEELAAHDPRAPYDLALRFFRGDGVRQDSCRSIKWMRDAAERGELNAQKALGRLYLTGLGEMGSDPGEAEKWLSITASREIRKRVHCSEKRPKRGNRNKQSIVGLTDGDRFFITPGILDIPIAGIGVMADGICISA